MDLQPITLTDAAVKRISSLLTERGNSSAGVRIGVRTRGYSGLSYTLEFADEDEPMDQVVEVEGIKVLIDPKAALFVIGTEMDFVEGEMESGFVFLNPNEKGRCGCGESFRV